MSPIQSLEDVRQVITDYDATHRSCPVAERKRELREEKLERARTDREAQRQRDEQQGASAAASPPSGGSGNMRATTVRASNEWWQQLDQRIYQCIKLWVEQWYPRNVTR